MALELAELKEQYPDDKEISRQLKQYSQKAFGTDIPPLGEQAKK